MSNWAEIDNDNTVVRVLVGDNNDPSGDEGYGWLLNNLGGKWIKTSYNSKIRGIYASVGDLYNEQEDIFVKPQPYPSWIRSGSFWHAPIEQPNDGKKYFWDEELGDWVEALAE